MKMQPGSSLQPLATDDDRHESGPFSSKIRIPRSPCLLHRYAPFKCVLGGTEPILMALASQALPLIMIHGPCSPETQLARM
jgi:hypothetical protein